MKFIQRRIEEKKMSHWAGPKISYSYHNTKKIMENHDFFFFFFEITCFALNYPKTNIAHCGKNIHL